MRLSAVILVALIPAYAAAVALIPRQDQQVNSFWLSSVNFNSVQPRSTANFNYRLDQIQIPVPQNSARLLTLQPLVNPISPNPNTFILKSSEPATAKSRFILQPKIWKALRSTTVNYQRQKQNETSQLALQDSSH